MSKTKTNPKIPFSLRLTTEEHATLKQAAGDVSMANFARARLFDGKSILRKKRGLRPVKDRQALGRVLGRLGVSNVSQNLHILAEAAKTGCLVVDSKTQRELLEACAEIKAMRCELMLALGMRVESPRSVISIDFREAAE